MISSTHTILQGAFLSDHGITLVSYIHQEKNNPAPCFEWHDSRLRVFGMHDSPARNSTRTLTKQLTGYKNITPELIDQFHEEWQKHQYNPPQNSSCFLLQKQHHNSPQLLLHTSVIGLSNNIFVYQMAKETGSCVLSKKSTNQEMIFFSQDQEHAQRKFAFHDNKKSISLEKKHFTIIFMWYCPELSGKKLQELHGTLGRLPWEITSKKLPLTVPFTTAQVNQEFYSKFTAHILNTASKNHLMQLSLCMIIIDNDTLLEID